MSKPRRIQRRAAVKSEVSITLRGWPGEVRRLTVVDEYWEVAFEFTKEGYTQLVSLKAFDNYSEAYAFYERYREFLQ